MQEHAPLLTATRRERVGTRYSKRIREAGGLPAIIYGHGKEPVAVSVDAKKTLRHLHEGEKILQLQIEGQSEVQNVLVKDLQFDYLGTNVIHADFTRVDLEERVELKVAIHLIGEAVGLKAAGAMLMHPTNEIELECKVANIPDHVEVDISGLEAGSALHVSDIQLPLPTMKTLSDPDLIVAQIIIQAVEEEETEEAGVVADGAQPEVITEKKEGED
ncbi:MAG: 50S ribosomal protein L25 [Planctomycetota bacterium]|nr:50S ribosomal protein L25 [Planctomycetota bacterium]